MQSPKEIRMKTLEAKIQLSQIKLDESRFAYYWEDPKAAIVDQALFCKNVDAMIREENKSAKDYRAMGLKFIGNDEESHAKVLKLLKNHIC